MHRFNESFRLRSSNAIQSGAYIFVELGNGNRITLRIDVLIASATYVPAPDLPVGCLC